jgi:hypothetical protein
MKHSNCPVVVETASGECFCLSRYRLDTDHIRGVSRDLSSAGIRGWPRRPVAGTNAGDNSPYIGKHKHSSESLEQALVRIDVTAKWHSNY